MKINVKKIVFSGIGESQKFSIQYFLKIEDKDLRIKKPVTGGVVFTKLDDRLLADFKTRVELEVRCVRCLDKFTFIKNLQFIREYLIEKSDRKEDISNEVLNIGDDFIVDVNGPIREEIILSLPMKLVCKEDCKGLCDQCGKNLNKEKCNCKKLTPLRNKPQYLLLEKRKKSFYRKSK